MSEPRAPEHVKVGDRVWLVEDIEQHNRIVVGTVKSVSAAGYVRVWWDTVFPVSHFSPKAARERLRVVVGRDALPRHDWDTQWELDPPCRRCGVVQSDENEHDACEANDATR